MPRAPSVAAPGRRTASRSRSSPTSAGGTISGWFRPDGGWPTQLTISDQRQKDPAWSPDGKWIAYASDYDGNEQWDVFAVSPKTGDVQNLTTTKEISEDSPVWSPDSKYLAYIRKPKGGSSYEIDMMDFSTRHVRHITKDTPADKSNFGPIFSRDDQSLVYTQADAGDRNSNIFLVELAVDEGDQPHAPSGRADLLRIRHVARRQDRPHHLKCAERIQECWVAGYRNSENYLADQRQVGGRAPDRFLPMAPA